MEKYFIFHIRIFYIYPNKIFSNIKISSKSEILTEINKQFGSYVTPALNRKWSYD